MADQPWYTYNRIDNFGQIDPQGNYYKPDSNVITPYGAPITALLSGTVTSVQRTGYGQTVVTVKLDKAINSLATHTFYEHMHSSTVTQGQRVNAGDLIGYANLQGEGANLGFGLYPGDVYAVGPGWAQLQSDLAPGGAGLLNPVKLLDAAKASGGKLTGLAGLSFQNAIDSNNGNPTGQQLAGDVQSQLAAMWQAAIPTLVSWGEHIAVFSIALLLIIIGFALLAEKSAAAIADRALP